MAELPIQGDVDPSWDGASLKKDDTLEMAISASFADFSRPDSVDKRVSPLDG